MSVGKGVVAVVFVRPQAWGRTGADSLVPVPPYAAVSVCPSFNAVSISYTSDTINDQLGYSFSSFEHTRTRNYSKAHQTSGTRNTLNVHAISGTHTNTLHAISGKRNTRQTIKRPTSIPPQDSPHPKSNYDATRNVKKTGRVFSAEPLL